MSYNLFDVADLQYALSFPVARSQDYKKQVSFILAQKNLGPKRLAALPYLISTHGLRNYGTFLADPDQWIANLRNPAANFADQITGMVTEAKARVAGRSRQRFLTPPSFSGATPSASGSQAVGCVSKNIKIFLKKRMRPNKKSWIKQNYIINFIFYVISCQIDLLTRRARERSAGPGASKKARR